VPDRDFFQNWRERLSRAGYRAVETVFRCSDHMAAFRDRLPSRPNVPGSTVLAYGAVGIMAVMLYSNLVSLTPPPVLDEYETQAPANPWSEITRMHGAFALEAPQLDGLEQKYIVRRHREGGGRKDYLTFGGPSEPGAYVRVALYRPGAEGALEQDALEAVTAVASESSIEAELLETENRLKTKFGLLSVIEMNVKGADGKRNCVAVANAWQNAHLGLVAWWCNGGPELVSHGALACVLDRLSLMSAGGDERLADFFARAELKRGHCGTQNALVSPTLKHSSDWMSAKPDPKLRGRVAGR
jgi:hypothetical protein